jgi:hypothetical protein
MANEQEQVAESPESQERPTPEFSEDKQTSPSGQADELVDAVLEKLTPEMEKIAEKQWQAGKDRRISQHETRLDSLEGALAEYDELRESGMSSAEAKDKMSMNRTLKSLKEEIASLKGEDRNQASGGTDSSDWTSKEQAILDRVGMDPNSQQFTEFVRSKTWESPGEYLAELQNKAFEWRTSKANAPQPSAASAAQTAGQSGVQPDLEVQYKEEMKKLRESGNSDPRAVFNIKKKYRDKGLDVS